MKDDKCFHPPLNTPEATKTKIHDEMKAARTSAIPIVALHLLKRISLLPKTFHFIRSVYQSLCVSFIKYLHKEIAYCLFKQTLIVR